MTSRSAVPDTTKNAGADLTDEDVAALMPLITQLQQARSDQREALTWLAEHPVVTP
jgi:hypothetical protein